MKPKYQNITLSFPAELFTLLQTEGRNINQFVIDAVIKALEKELLELEAEYEAASKNPERLIEIEKWKVLDNLNDIEGWE